MNIDAKRCKNGIGFNVEYLSELCAGTMRYTAPENPVRIDGDGRMAALMPMRLNY